jgi:acyl-coenzyme A thioesterase PaaI-like protein
VNTELHQLAGCLDVATWNRLGVGRLPGLVGLEIVAVTLDRLESRLAVRDELMAPNGFLQGANGFTTVELKSNFFGTARDGTLCCVATPLHRGRTTQVWDAAVTRADDDRPLASFRCTQMVLGGRG